VAHSARNPDEATAGQDILLILQPEFNFSAQFLLQDFNLCSVSIRNLKIFILNFTHKIYKNNSKFLAILFDEMHIEEFKKELRKLMLPIRVYAFSLEGDDFAEDFEDLENDITVCSIPEAILRVYRRIFRK